MDDGLISDDLVDNVGDFAEDNEENNDFYDDITDDFGDDDMNFYDEEPNEGDYDGDNDSNYMNDGGDNDDFFGDYGGKDYAGNDWMNLFAVFSFGWFLCGASLLVWSCYTHKYKAQWK